MFDPAVKWNQCSLMTLNSAAIGIAMFGAKRSTEFIPADEVATVFGGGMPCCHVVGVVVMLGCV